MVVKTAFWKFNIMQKKEKETEKLDDLVFPCHSLATMVCWLMPVNFCNFVNLRRSNEDIRENAF